MYREKKRGMEKGGNGGENKRRGSRNRGSN